MAQFHDALEEALTQTARREHRRSARPGRVMRLRGARPRLTPWIVAGLALCLVAAGLLVGLPGGNGPSVPSAEAFAIFKRPAVDVSSLSVLKGRARDGMDLRDARAFATSSGTGYVVPSADGESICLSIPDTADSWGGTCARREAVESRGLRAELISPEPTGPPTQVSILLPIGQDSATIDYGAGRVEPMTVTDGVANAAIMSDATIRYASAGGAPIEFRARAVEPQGDYYVDCGDGRPAFKVRGVKDTYGAGYKRVCASG